MVSGVFFLLISTIMCSSDLAEAKPGGNSQVEVRAVFINCEPDVSKKCLYLVLSHLFDKM